jgi:hypothetical protein
LLTKEWKFSAKTDTPNQPPHFAKCEGNLALKSGLYTNTKNSNFPRIFLHFSRLVDSPLALIPRLRV